MTQHDKSAVLAEKPSLRMRIADIIGAENNSPEARATYLLVDYIEVLEKRVADLELRTTGLQRF